MMVDFPKWFEALSPEEFCSKSIEAATKNNAPPKALRKIKTNLKFVLRELKEKGGFFPGIQHGVCPCGMEHDSIVCLREKALVAAPESERIKVACERCNFIMPYLFSFYGEDRAKKIIDYLWGNKTGGLH